MNNMGAAMAPAAADTLRRHLMDTGRTAADYDLIISGDLGKIGHDLLLTLMMDAGVPLDAARYVDCGMLIFSPEQDVHAGGSGCGCSASVLCGYIMRLFREKAIHRVAFMATGALLSPTFSQQGGAIPGIAHLIVLEADEA
jgi:stage V sporulation protein AD